MIATVVASLALMVTLATTCASVIGYRKLRALDRVTFGGLLKAMRDQSDHAVAVQTLTARCDVMRRVLDALIADADDSDEHLRRLAVRLGDVRMLTMPANLDDHAAIARWLDETPDVNTVGDPSADAR